MGTPSPVPICKATGQPDGLKIPSSIKHGCSVSASSVVQTEVLKGLASAERTEANLISFSLKACTIFYMINYREREEMSHSERFPASTS